ncbi:YebC/PmpR family DNA-binding transcriptional regulator [candidate division WOR-3 bacterium JGI_Cruoil_03_44_89]|uniref:Probable transcriptional regulatory protein CH333_09755 n=1 Tax=candidate division WOR-3 bacterium JGI_Cruoil_03_44_89 TaxID=1973748 RepID=A0A235BNR1_UNCW3|nr:MAG: YebC/PmpR family DNA-binding transcriptional regulator [candidate division WOR-3 bacterium JGI_Cruoil_03_44_89]
MSGHSKWAQIKRKKGKLDAQRGRTFTRLIREITVAARQGGGNPETNSRLRSAVDTAKAQNMPQDNIKKAIMRGTGELEGINYEEISYEGYGPCGVAILIEALTDNKNRTTSEIRHILSHHGGNLGENGCVSWMFKDKGIIYIDKERVDEERLLTIALDAGAEDVIAEDDSYQIITSPKDFETLKSTLKSGGIEYSSAELTKSPQSTIKIGEKDTKSILKLMDVLEEHDDVQHIYANFDIPDELLKEAV